MTTEFVIKFDYTLEALQAIAKESEHVDLSDIEAVKEEHKKFVKIRTTIKKQEKEMVDGANDFRSKVFDKRNEYLAITEPVEKKFKDILDAEEFKNTMEIRRSLLAGKKQSLASLDISPVSDDFILTLDDTQWVAFFQEKIAENTSNIAKKEAEKKREADQKVREERIKKEMVEKAEIEKKQALAKAEKDKVDAIAKVKREAQEKVEKEKRDKELAEKKEAEAQAKLEASKKYQKYLADNNYNQKTDIIVETSIYRLVATFKK